MADLAWKAFMGWELHYDCDGLGTARHIVVGPRRTSPSIPTQRQVSSSRKPRECNSGMATRPVSGAPSGYLKVQSPPLHRPCFLLVKGQGSQWLRGCSTINGSETSKAAFPLKRLGNILPCGMPSLESPWMPTVKTPLFGWELRMANTQHHRLTICFSWRKQSFCASRLFGQPRLQRIASSSCGWLSREGAWPLATCKKVDSHISRIVPFAQWNQRLAFIYSCSAMKDARFRQALVVIFTRQPFYWLFACKLL